MYGDSAISLVSDFMIEEQHPFEPFLPRQARLLMLGTFPPAEKRWAMKFYYPNFTNDMWRIFGICFFGDKMHFVRQQERTYDLDAIIPFLRERGIALFDTATRIVRTKNTASDKDLLIVEETDLKSMLRSLPECRMVITAGQLATTIAARQFSTVEPRVGEKSTFTLDGRSLQLYRMPSSSRAYPMAVEKKAKFYQQVFSQL
jgi:G:T/U-mismatch repair DNA glycosylase